MSSLLPSRYVSRWFPAEDGAARILAGGSLGVFLVALVGCFRVPRPWDPELQAAIAERVDAGRLPTVDQYLGMSLLPALVACAVMALVLVLAAPHWTRRQGPAYPQYRPVHPRFYIVIALVFACALAASFRGPRLHHSFWNDEEVTMKDYAWGEWRATGDEGGEDYEFRRPPWKDTVFYNRGGSNHVLNSILTRSTLTFASWFRSSEPDRFSEATARAIPFIASLLTIFLLGYILACNDHRFAGITAACLLALNPWHLRYSVEIRGYSVMLLLMLLTGWFLWLALTRGRRRWWAGFALCQFLYLLAFGGAIYVAAAMNAVVAGVLLWRARANIASLVRLGAWNMVSAIPFVFLMAPSVPQFIDYLKEERMMVSFGPGWMRDYFSHLTAGIRPSNRFEHLHNGFGLDTLVAENPLSGVVLLWVIPLAACVGAVVLIARGGAGRVFALVFLGATGLSLGHNYLADNPTFPWYLLYSVLAYCGFAGAAAEVFRYMPVSRLVRIGLCGGLGLVLVALYAVAANRPLHALALYPRQPIRDTVETMRGVAPTYGRLGDTEALTATFGTSQQRLLSYDPRVIRLRSLEDLEALAARAHEEERTLWVAFCGRQRALQDNDAALVGYLEDPETGFEKVKVQPGWEEMWTYHIFRLSGEG